MRARPRRLWYGPKGAAVLVVGEAPARRIAGRPELALVGTGLEELGGLSLLEWLLRVARVNLLDRWPGAAPKGDLFDAPAARAHAERLRPALPRFRRVVLLGRRVESAFGLERGEWFEARDPEGRVAVAPHPSRVSHWWNEGANYLAARAFWTGVVG